MATRKGELTASGVDQGWPHQIALRADLSTGKQGIVQADFCQNLSKCNRGHSVFYEGDHYNVHCFALRQDAEAFLAQFGGEWFDPRERGRGHNWSAWYKGKYSKGR